MVQWKSKGICAILPQDGSQWSNPYDFEVIPETVGQHIDKEDILDQPIYEGDMLFCGNKHSPKCMLYEAFPDYFEVRHDLKVNGFNSFPMWKDEDKLNELIKHFGGMITWPRERVLSNFWHYEIIGNIHDQ